MHMGITEYRRLHACCPLLPPAELLTLKRFPQVLALSVSKDAHVTGVTISVMVSLIGFRYCTEQTTGQILSYLPYIAFWLGALAGACACACRVRPPLRIPGHTRTHNQLVQAQQEAFLVTTLAGRLQTRRGQPLGTHYCAP